MTPELRGRFRDRLDRRPELVPAGATVVVAFSGGPDSTALLDLLRAAAPDRDLRIVAAHFDHRVRPESSEEAELAGRRAGELGVEVRVGRRGETDGDVPAELRRLRYRFLRRVAREEGGDRIATGHHADDQAETVLFRLLRGTGLRGLGGIPARRGDVVRPLLPFRASELRDHLLDRGLSWIRDPSNRTPDHARSRIRHRLIPALRRAWGEDPTARLLRVGSEARAAEERMERLTADVLRWCRRPAADPFRVPELTADVREERRVRFDRTAVLRSGRELQARLLRRVARGRGHRLSRGGTAEAVEFINAGRSGGRVQLGGGLELWREFDTFWMGPAEARPEDLRLEVDASRPGRGRFRVGGRSYVASWGPGDAPAGRRTSLAMPREIRQLSLTLRGWRDGDRIELRGTRHKLKELFNRTRVPVSERHRLPLLVSGENRVLWVPGIADAVRRAQPEDEEQWWIGVNG